MGEWGMAESAYGMVGVISIGLGLLLLAVGQRNRASVGLTGLFVLVGIAFPVSMALAGQVDPEHPGLVPRLVPLLEGGSVAFAGVWLSGLLASSSAADDACRWIRRIVRIGFALAGSLGIAGALWPAQRFNDFQSRLLDQSAWERPAFWGFLSLWVAIALVFTAGCYLLSRERLDRGERTRARALVIASPILVVTLMLPVEVGLVSGTLSMLIALFGQLRYVAAQAERGVFLRRFLSPQVAELVTAEGLDTVSRAQEVELTAVACDLRGFTAYAEAVPSQAVIDLLSEYYEAVGTAVAEVNGTVKDYAGDGVLVLIGAPLPQADHADLGLRLAHRIIELTAPVLARWRTPIHPLGVGVGVATGRVTVGAIGSAGRLEYTAVGTAVNLAARLCARAVDGQVLADGGTVSRAPSATAEAVGTVELRGISAPHDVFESRPPGFSPTTVS